MDNLNTNVYYIHKYYSNDIIPNDVGKYGYKGHSTKRGNNHKDIIKRRKKNKNKKTHRK